MEKRLRTRWVKALRSGKYIQGRNHLRLLGDKKLGNPTTHCCLGVLSEVCKFPIRGRQGFLTKGQLKKVGMSEGVQRQLAEFNDTGDKSFRGIARWIETHDLLEE